MMMPSSFIRFLEPFFAYTDRPDKNPEMK